jgi:hypothetical protein
MKIKDVVGENQISFKHDTKSMIRARRKNADF